MAKRWCEACGKEACGIDHSRKEPVKLKLFVWTGFCPDYSDGLAFAIAEDAEQAMNMIVEDRGIEVYTWGDLKIHDLNTPFAKCVSGGG